MLFSCGKIFVMVGVWCAVGLGGCAPRDHWDEHRSLLAYRDAGQGAHLHAFSEGVPSPHVAPRVLHRKQSATAERRTLKSFHRHPNAQTVHCSSLVSNAAHIQDWSSIIQCIQKTRP